jgi:hypothetical protein
MNGSLVSRIFGTAIFCVSVGLSAAACSGDPSTTSTSSSGDGGGGAGGGGNTAGNGERYAEAFCGRTFDCCNITDLGERLINSSIVDYAGCRIVYRTIWDAAIEPIVAEGEKAGRVSFSQANFDACMQTVRGLSCADLGNVAAFCDNVFTPKVAAGQACYSNIECIDGTCDFPGGASAGTCKAKPAPVGMGGACTENAGCNAGLYCNGGTCAALKADGEACGNKDECLAGACVGGSPGKCAKICEGGGPGPGAIDKKLESLGASLAIAECNKAFECCSGDEFDTLLFSGVRAKSQCLSIYGVFLSLGLVQLHNSEVEGKVSIDGAAFQTCIDQFAGLTCQAFSKGAGIDCPNAIKGLIADGASCTDNTQCMNKYCNEPMPGQGTCATLPGAGAPCTDKCADGFYCNGGTCAAQKAIGGACTGKSECVEGNCYGAAGMKTCALICDGI